MVLDGKMVAGHIAESILTRCQSYKERLLPTPHLVVVMVGDNPASQTYVKNKQKMAAQCGIQSSLLHFDTSISEEFLLQEINRLNENDLVHGFFIQLPLPPHINKDLIISAINPAKDVDGFHPLNFGKMALGQDGFRPATPYGICKLLNYYNLETVGKHCVVIGRSNIVGKPLSIMLGNDFTIGRCTVTSIQIDTPPHLLLSECQKADIIIVAVGLPGFLKPEMVKEGAWVIDVGINRVDDKIVGDVDPAVLPKCEWFSPVPGGVGPMTIASLMWNTLLAYQKRYQLND